MDQHPFAIEFYYCDEGSGGTIATGSKYHAVITTLSKTLRLFKVSVVKRIQGDEMITLHECYHLTNHPLKAEKNESWKDVVTLSSDRFLQAIGHAIDRHLYTNQELAPHLN